MSSTYDRYLVTFTFLNVGQRSPGERVFDTLEQVDEWIAQRKANRLVGQSGWENIIVTKEAVTVEYEVIRECGNIWGPDYKGEGKV